MEESVLNIGKFSSVIRLNAFFPFKSAQAALENINAISEGKKKEGYFKLLHWNDVPIICQSTELLWWQHSYKLISWGWFVDLQFVTYNYWRFVPHLILAGVVHADLKLFLETNLPSGGKKKPMLGVSDAKIGATLQEELNLSIQTGGVVAEIIRGEHDYLNQGFSIFKVPRGPPTPPVLI